MTAGGSGLFVHSVSVTPLLLARMDIFASWDPYFSAEEGILAWMAKRKVLPVLALEVHCCVTLGTCPRLSDPIFPHLRVWPVSLWTPLALLLFGFHL